jgi:hypothetical protein
MSHSTNRKLIPFHNAAEYDKFLGIHSSLPDFEEVAVSLLCVSPPMLYEELGPESDENMGDEAYAYCLEDPSYERA